MKKASMFLVILLHVIFLTACGSGGGGGSGTSAEPESTSKDIISFKITSTDPYSIGTLGANTVTVIVPYGTDVTSLATEIAISGVSVSPASGAAQDFSSTVVYTVTAEDGSTKAYTVTVIVAPSSDKNITSFTIPGTNPKSFGLVGTDSIAITVPYGTNVTSLVPEIGITGASVSPASGAAQDSSSPVVYTVTAADSSTKNYMVTVTVALNSAKDITKFTINGRDGTISEPQGTIELALPPETAVTSLVPEIGITGAIVSPASCAAQDFSSPVVYTVKAADNSTKNYTVSVTVEPLVLVLNADGISFNMVHVRGRQNFPINTDDSGRASVGSYRIGDTEVTYALWNKVCTWANANGYTFANAGAMGGGDGPFTDQHPVTDICWRDVMVWTNALTEWYNTQKGTSFVPVYTYGGVTIRDATDAIACDSAVAGPANGFRLPTGNEWELAARFRDDADNTVAGFSNPWFTKGNSASGAVAGSGNAVATGAVAVCAPFASTAAVKSKLPNSLDLYDMSGNVWELCFDLIGSERAARGGSYVSESEYLQIGRFLTLAPDDPGEYQKLGLRLVMTE